MKKDAFFFPHDSNANCDPKCMLLIHQLGLEGYGIFWVLIETLREQADYKCPLALIPVLAERFKTSAEKMKTVISSFDLFTIEEDKFFYSPSLMHRLEVMNIKKLRKVEAGRKAIAARWGKPYEPNTNVSQNEYERNSDVSKKEYEAIPSDSTRRDNTRQDDTRRDETIQDESINTLRTHSESLLSYFQLTPGTNPTEASMAAQMVRLLMEAGRLDHFAAQFEAYKTYKAEANEFRHNFKSYVGTFAQGFMDGNWNAENWPEKLRQFRSRTSAQEGTLTDVQKQILEKTKW